MCPTCARNGHSLVRAHLARTRRTRAKVYPEIELLLETNIFFSSKMNRFSYKLQVNFTRRKFTARHERVVDRICFIRGKFDDCEKRLESLHRESNAESDCMGSKSTATMNYHLFADVQIVGAYTL